MSNKDKILKYLSSVESATLEDICENIDATYFLNAKKYIGEICSRMVNSRRLIRPKKGTYKINPSYRKGCKPDTSNNPKLF